MNGQTIGYVRVSSTDQNLQRQIVGIGDVDRVFEEQVSAKSRNRPVLHDMMTYARSGDTLRVLTIDRLARSTRDLLDLVEELLGKGVTVEFVDQHLSFTPGDQSGFATFQLTLLGAIAELERTMIRERQREGIEQAKKRGVYGRRRALTSEQVRGATHRIAEGVPKAVVARDLGVSRQTLYTELNRASR